MQYHQITSEERYAIAALRRQGYSARAIARDLGRAPSTDQPRGGAQPPHATTAATARTPPASARGRGAGARGAAASSGEQEWALVEQLIELDWSPEQVAGWLRLHRAARDQLRDHLPLRLARQGRRRRALAAHAPGGQEARKRYGAHDCRGRLAGKRHISERPGGGGERRSLGHWEIDTVKGDDQARHSVVTLVERATGYLEVGKLARHNAAEATRRTSELIARHPGRVATVTADNGSEFHSYALVEAATGDALLLRDPAPLLGARHEREHQRTAQAVPAEAHKHGAGHAGRLRRDRAQAEHAAEEEARLQDPGGVLCPSQVGESVRGTSVALRT